MKRYLLSLALGTLLLGGASALHAQLLENFSSFESASTLFYGDWSSTGDPFAGDLAPTGSFSQGAGFYGFASTTNVDTAYAELTFASSLNLGADDVLSLSLRLLDDNTADGLTVTLFDTSFNTAAATFALSDFSIADFTTANLAFTAFAGFDASDVAGFRLSGNDPFGGGVFSVALTNLEVTSSNSTPPAAVPEPGTYGLLTGIALASLVLWRRRRT